MKRKTNTTITEPTDATIQVNKDVMLAVLIVSLTVNLFILVGWVTLQVTSVDDAQVGSFLLTR